MQPEETQCGRSGVDKPAIDSAGPSALAGVGLAVYLVSFVVLSGLGVLAKAPPCLLYMLILACVGAPWALALIV